MFVYTIWLKPRTVQNIVIGGAAGAVPALVGWAAVRDDLASPAWLLFAVVFFWTPAHFWALAMKYRDDYAAAGIPMLPVVRGIEVTTRQIAGYAMLTVAVTFALTLTGDVGRLYAHRRVRARRGVRRAGARPACATRTPKRAIKFFVFSNVYLMLVFVAVAVDAARPLRPPTPTGGRHAGRCSRLVVLSIALPLGLLVTVIAVTRDSGGDDAIAADCTQEATTAPAPTAPPTTVATPDRGAVGEVAPDFDLLTLDACTCEQLLRPTAARPSC